MELIKKIYLTCASESNSGVTKGKIDLISTFNKIENLLILFVIKKRSIFKRSSTILTYYASRSEYFIFNDKRI